MDGSYITVGCRQLFKGVNASCGVMRVVGGLKKNNQKTKEAIRGSLPESRRTSSLRESQ